MDGAPVVKRSTYATAIVCDGLSYTVMVYNYLSLSWLCHWLVVIAFPFIRYDELIVSAPTYSSSELPELGRVYILRNVNMVSE